MLTLARLLARLPLRALHAIGAALGLFVYLASPRYRRNLRENLGRGVEGASFGLRLRAAAEAGRQALELFRVWLQPHEKALEMVAQASGWEQVAAALAAGRGVILLTPHLGCFDMAAQYCAAHGPITVLYRPPRQAWLGKLILEGRGRCMKLAATDLSGVRSLMKALKRREMVGLLPDQVPAFGEGVWADFFGRPAYTMTLAARLSEIGGVAVFFVAAERLPGGRGFHLHYLPPSTPLQGDTAARVDQINREVERLVCRWPSQYLWGYNRYKVPAGVAPPPERGRC